MAFELPDEVLDVKKKAREFVEKELISLEKKWPHHTDEVPREEKVELGKKAQEAGILGPGSLVGLGWVIWEAWWFLPSFLGLPPVSALFLTWDSRCSRNHSQYSSSPRTT